MGDAFLATILGGASMLMFAIGASIPVIGVLLVTSKAGNMVKTQEYIRRAKVVFSVALVVIGFRILYEYVYMVLAKIL
jgi:cytochrome c biogenesis protein CcdA